MATKQNNISLPAVPIYLFWAIIAINALGLFNPIFTEDSALYASIAKRFLVSGDLLNIYVDGHDWLDKPHFPFWAATLSMYLFGVSGFSYKLSSLLFFLLGLFYTYRFAKEIYGKEVAGWAVLILASALHIIVSNNDVRAESYLLGAVMGGVYHFYRLSLRYSLKHLLLGALYGAVAVMTKGIFTLIVPAVAIFGDAVLKKRYHILFRLRWLWAFLLIGLFITPELYALYNQFDMHPEKVVFGKEGVSGLRFFFLDSQLGRFFNEGPIVQEPSGDIFFFLHTLLWAFAPWAILLYISVFVTAKKIGKGQPVKEYCSFSVSVFMLLLFSVSGFKLPHYTNIIMPFFSIMVAQFLLHDSFQKKARVLKGSFFIHCIIFVALVGAVDYLFQPGRVLFFYLLLLPFIGIAFLIYRLKITPVHKFFYLSCLISLLVGAYLNLRFYPKLLTYQAGIRAAKYVNEHFPTQKVMIVPYARLFEFYVKAYSLERYPISAITKEHAKQKRLVYARQFELNDLQQRHIPYKIIKEFDDFHTTGITFDFLYHNTREATLSKGYLIKIHPTPDTPIRPE